MALNNKMLLFFKDELRAFQAFQVVIAIVCFFIPLILRIWDRDDFYPAKVSLNGFNKAKNGEITIRIDTINKILDDAYQDSFMISACPVNPDSPEIKILTAQIIYKDKLGFRKSISHYALSSNSYLFGLLYCMAAMMFIYNAMVYWKIRKSIVSGSIATELDLNKYEPVYNLIIGICLIMVVCHPFNTQQIPHVVFSVVFFAVNLGMMIFFPSKNRAALIKKRKLTEKKRFIIALVFVAAMFFLSLMHILSILWVEWIALTFIAFRLILIVCEANKISEK